MNKINWNFGKLGVEQIDKDYFRRDDRETFSRHFAEGERILEIGCGTGNILTHLCQTKGCLGHGIDIDSISIGKALELAQYKKVSINVQLASGFYLPYRDNSFDAAYSEGVIEHFPRDEMVKMIAEHVRVCKTRGKVIISVPNKYHVVHTLRKKIKGTRFRYYPEDSLSYRELSMMMEKTGLLITDVDGTSPARGFAFLPMVKELVRILRFAPYKWLPQKARAIIGFQCLVVGQKR